MTTDAGDEGTTAHRQRLALAAATFDALPAQVAVLDDEGTILATNRAWAAFGVEGGLPDGDAVGQNYLGVCDAAADDGDVSAMAAADGIRAVLGGERDEFSFEYPCHSPTERRWFTMRALPLSAVDRPRVLVMHMDITERKEAELAVEAHNETLETVAGVLGHDLRNPLNVALARAEQLAADPAQDPEAVAESASSIVDSLDRMTDIVSDALVIARDTDEADPEPVELAHVARRAWSHVETGAATLDVDSSATVAADDSLLSQLLENLYRNALDHAGDAPAVTVGVTESGFYVADDGRGIPAGERETVFETGYTTGGGTGMGLSIVRRVADAHDWTVAVTDATDDPDAPGARFEVAGVARPD